MYLNLLRPSLRPISCNYYICLKTVFCPHVVACICNLSTWYGWTRGLWANLAKTLSEMQSKTNNSNNNKTKLKKFYFFSIFGCNTHYAEIISWRAAMCQVGDVNMSGLLARVQLSEREGVLSLKAGVQYLAPKEKIICFWENTRDMKKQNEKEDPFR